MLSRISLMTVACATASLLLVLGIAGHDRSVSAEKPATSQTITVLHDVRYREGPSKSWRLDLAYKKDSGGKPRPGIVVIHGGGWVEGDKSSFASRKAGVPGNIEDFAELGFVAATINYRLSGEAPFPAALDDCRCAVRWLRAHAKDYNLDPKHIGAYGNSAGGHLSLLLAMPNKEPALDKDTPYRDESSLVQKPPSVTVGRSICFTSTSMSAAARGRAVHGRAARGRADCGLQESVAGSANHRGYAAAVAAVRRRR